MQTLAVLSVSLAVFGAWSPVTPETVYQPVPEWHVESSSFGSVMSKVQRMAKPAARSCPVYESGRVVGARLNCSGADVMPSEFLPGSGR